MVTEEEATKIFTDALEACGKTIAGFAEDLRRWQGLTGDDTGDDFSAVVECTQWLEYIMNLNNDPIPVDVDVDGKPYLRYKTEEWLPTVLQWAIDNRETWRYDLSYGGDEVFDPHNSLPAWHTCGAPSCELYKLLNPEED